MATSTQRRLIPRPCNRLTIEAQKINVTEGGNAQEQQVDHRRAITEFAQCAGRRTGDELLDRFQQLVEPERLVEHRLQSGLPGPHDRVARVVAEAGHQGHRHGFHHFLELQQQVVARHVGQADVGNDRVVALIVREAADHELGFAAVVGRFDDAADSDPSRA